MPANLQKARDLFLHAVGHLPAEQWEGYVAQACGGDAELAQQVEALLQVHREAGSFLNAPAPGLEATLYQPSLEQPGTQIGPYKLMEQIGEGGMGLVFVAEQQQPVRRKVALKVIKPGMDSREVIARFEAERQALALMDHANIARVFDAGATESGRPYFVMELVRGIPIVDYCDQQQRTAGERLELFLTVCQAVQHAHSKGIIHRDLKPSNILVAPHDGVPVVKVIDFGVAKAIGQQLTDKTIYTRFTQMIGTPLYMSPEQAEINALDVDTRSDVYSLGVLLYELLTGTTPFDRQQFATAAYDEIRRMIREVEPPKPSTRLSTMGASLSQVSDRRRTEPAKLSALVRGDLDWIVMKSLEKDRNRRYDTATALARDVERYLHDEPVEACPPSRAYRVKKFVRRNKGPVLAALLILMALVAGVVGTTWSLIREQQQSQELQAAHQRERVLNERARQAIEAVMSETALEQLTRQQELRPEQKDFLDKMLQYYAESTKEVAATEEERSRQQQAYHRMGRLNQILGRSQVSENAYRRAVALGTQLVADFPARPEFRQELAHSHNALGVLLSTTRSREKESAYGEALTILKQLAADFPTRQEFRQALAGVHNNLGNLFAETGRPKEAEEAHAEALAIRKQLAADFPTGRNIRRALAMSHSNLGWIFRTTERLPEAEAAFREAVALQRQQLAEYPNQPEFRLELAKYLFHLGNVLRDTGRSNDAEAARAEAVVIFNQLVADYPNRPEFRQELAERGLQEVGRGVGDEGEEDPTSGALGAIDSPESPKK